MRQNDGARLAVLDARSFAFLLANLVCLGFVPLFLWLAEERIVPYREEAGWVRARKSLLPSTNDSTFEKFAGAHVTLERRGCFDTCPRYRVTVWGSGRVKFEGLRFVCAPGIHHAQVEARRAVDLIIDMYVGGFFYDLHWIPEPAITDQSTVVTELSLWKLNRRIEHYHGDTAAPRVLRDMENAIDEVAGTARWVPKRGRDQDCRVIAPH